MENLSMELALVPKRLGASDLGETLLIPAFLGHNLATSFCVKMCIGNVKFVLWIIVYSLQSCQEAAIHYQDMSI